MVPVVIFNEVHIMPCSSFSKRLRVTAKIFQEVLRCTVWPWIDRWINGHPYAFQPHFGFAQKARMTLAWMLNIVSHSSSLEWWWLPSSPDSNPLQHFSVAWSKPKAAAHQNHIWQSWRYHSTGARTVDKNMVVITTILFCSHLELAVSAADPYLQI